MNITWILSSANITQVDGNVTSELASYRYRVAIPMRELRLRGHTCSWIALGGAAHNARSALAALEQTDVAIFSKNHTEQEQVVAMLESVQARGIPAIADVCDDYFERGAKYEDYYRFLVTKRTP